MTVLLKSAMGGFLGLAACMIVATPVHAVATTVVAPPDLGAGASYRLVFVTSGLMNASSHDIADYNAFVTSQANVSAELAALATSWKVLGSTSSVDAKTNSATDPAVAGGVPIYNLRGELVASNYADLWDGLLAKPINFDQYGAAVSQAVFTGTSTSGTGIPDRQLGGPNGYRVQYGYSNAIGSGWTNANDWTGTLTALHYYGISDTLAIPVPEPEAYLMMLAGLGLVGFVARRRRA